MLTCTAELYFYKDNFAMHFTRLHVSVQVVDQELKQLLTRIKQAGGLTQGLASIVTKGEEKDKLKSLLSVHAQVAF